MLDEAVNLDLEIIRTSADWLATKCQIQLPSKVPKRMLFPTADCSWHAWICLLTGYYCSYHSIKLISTDQSQPTPSGSS
jgi:hypothetical protein